MKQSKWVWGIVVVALAWGGYRLAKGPQSPVEAKKEKGPPSVLVIMVRQGDVPLEIEATGQVAPLQLVEVRPQIAGQVRKVLIREGQDVRVGQPLFQLEDGSARAALETARAQKARDEAQLADAQRILMRNRSLQQQNFVAPSAVDSAASTVDSLKAAIAADIAAIRAAEVDLAYKTVPAQISGRSGTINVFPGSVVTPTQATPMTTIAQLDPISVSFNIAESALPQLFAAKSQQQLKVRASLVDAAAADELLGQLSFIDNAVDSRSGTIRVKAQFDNRAGKLWPGMYVHLRLQAGVQKQALMLPVGAVQSGPDGKFAFVLGADNRLQAQPLTLLAIRNEQAIVNGLPAGSVVVAGSGVNLRPGDQIKPKFAADKAGAKP